jgi:LSD1 subclass zinc finger protein
MGLFNKNRQEPPPERPSTADRMALAQQKMAQAMELQAQLTSMQAQAMQQAAAFQQQAVTAHQASPGGAPAGSMTWVRQVLAILAPPQAGFVKRCSCVVCGAPKKLPTVTAYVYCDYCASLIDYDLRRACEGDSVPGPAYAATVNATQAASRAAVAAGDRDAYLDLQRTVYEAYATNVPMAVSHRAKNDPEYRARYVDFMAAFAAARAFDPVAQALEAEMKQRVMGIRYGGPMMSPTVEPDSFWPVADTLAEQIECGRSLYRTAGLVEIDPDHAEHLTGKFAWSGFCQGWLSMLPADAAELLLDRACLKNQYVPIEAHDGQPRHCGGCGAEFGALPGATAVICEGCGRKIDLGSAEIPCASCGATMTLPFGADDVACPFCQSRVERAGIR